MYEFIKKNKGHLFYIALFIFAFFFLARISAYQHNTVRDANRRIQNTIGELSTTRKKLQSYIAREKALFKKERELISREEALFEKERDLVSREKRANKQLGANTGKFRDSLEKLKKISEESKNNTRYYIDDNKRTCYYLDSDGSEENSREEVVK